MRFLFRLIGTWTLGLALVLVVIDGAKSLAASNFVMTPLAGIWRMLHAQSFANADQWARESAFNPIWIVLQNSLFAWPAFAIFGVLGLLFVFWGRRPTSRIQSLGDF